jgi:hypothetical protein
MWGLYPGLDMAWRESLSHLIVESDSMVFIDMVTNNCNINGTIHSLVQLIQEILRQEWHTQVIHTWREGIICDDWLANFSLFYNSWNLVFLESAPNEL